MDKPYYNKGFTLVEMILVLFVISTFTVLVLPLISFPNLDYYLFANEYLLFQSECIKENKQEEFYSEVSVNYNYPIVFNEKGNVQMAQTITFPFEESLKLISQLGGGRLEFK